MYSVCTCIFDLGTMHTSTCTYITKWTLLLGYLHELHRIHVHMRGNIHIPGVIPMFGLAGVRVVEMLKAELVVSVGGGEDVE